MQWIILIGDESLTLNSIKAVKHHGAIRCHDIPEMRDRYCVDYGDHHVFYDFDDRIINDYEEAELNKIPFAYPHFIMMVYHSKEQMKEILRQDNFLRGIYVDDDHGNIMPIEDFIEL